MGLLALLSVNMLIILAVILFFAVLFIILIVLAVKNYEPGNRRAGRKGEEYVSDLIREVLDEEDILITNVPIIGADKETELDNVIINKNGVFIIEVKNYSGTLQGDEDDYEWVKKKISSGGELYIKNVKNPIKQVKRQIYVLSQFLKENNIDVWIDGYVFLVERNSPINSMYVLESREDIDDAIHSQGRQTLSTKNIRRIAGLLENNRE